MRAVVAVAFLAALTPLALTARASALSEPTQWDGSNPFNCRIQATRVLRAGRTILPGEQWGRVSFLVIYSPKAISTKRELSGFLERAR